MNAHATRTFQSGNSEAVRLPKGLGFGIGTEVRIERDGNRLVLTPVDDPEAVRASMRQLVEDLRRITGPDGLPREERDVDWWPERPGL
jgi:antitoxin VapB